MRVVICPICGGKGEICTGVVMVGNVSGIPVITPITVPCHGCGVFPHGKGWIVIPDRVIFPVREK